MYLKLRRENNFPEAREFNVEMLEELRCEASQQWTDRSEMSVTMRTFCVETARFSDVVFVLEYITVRK